MRKDRLRVSKRRKSLTDRGRVNRKHGELKPKLENHCEDHGRRGPVWGRLLGEKVEPPHKKVRLGGKGDKVVQIEA